MKNKVGLSILAIVISGCVLLSAGLIIGAFFLLKSTKNYVPPTTPQVATLAPSVTQQNSTLDPNITPNATFPSGTNLPPEITSQMDQIQKEVTGIRGLNLKSDLSRALMTPEQLKNKVINDFFKDYSADDAKRDVKVLSTLGLLDPTFDLHTFYINLYSEQVAGYYDSKTKEMYVIAGEQFGGLERMTYSHEFTHVLQDQNFDLENGLKLNSDYCQKETEYCAAATALVEGDATLSEQFWFIQYSTNQDKNDITQFQKTYKSPVYDSAPDYMKQDFLFPYQQGYDFVNQLYGSKKWTSIDAAFKNPPVSTEQILHPDKYPNDVPIKIDVPDLTSKLGSGWKEIDRNTMGEWYTYLILEAGRNTQLKMPAADASKAAAGWGGDTYTYYTNDKNNQYVFAWQSTWDTATDSSEFFDLSIKYGQARWGNPVGQTSTTIKWQSDVDGSVSIYKNNKDVLWLLSSNNTLQQEVLPSYPTFTN